MRYRRLGGSGLAVSVVGLGGNNFERRADLAATRAVVDAAFDVGINFIDTADMYGGSEDYLGEVLQGRRDEIVLATKVGHVMKGKLGPDWGARGGRRYLKRAVESSLRHLGFEVGEARVGRLVDVELATDDRDEALAQLSSMCEQLLTNPLIETYVVQLADNAVTEAA